MARICNCGTVVRSSNGMCDRCERVGGSTPSVEEMLEYLHKRAPEVHTRTMKYLKDLEEAYRATKDSELHLG